MKDDQNLKICMNLMTRSQGSVLIALVVAMIVIGVLGAAVVSLHGTSSIHEVRANHAERAYYLAESGFRYAHSVWQETEDEDKVEALNGTSIYVPSGGKIKFINVEHNNSTSNIFTVNEFDDQNSVLSIENVNATYLPKYNGIFEIENNNCTYRYLHYDNSTDTLEKIQAVSDEEACFDSLEDGGSATSLDHLVVESRGSFPGSGDLNVNRTVTYWWPVSDQSGDEGELPVTDSQITLQSKQDLTADNHNYVDGSISGDDIELNNHSEITGDVVSISNVRLINHSEVGGGICAIGDVYLENHTTVNEDINAHGDVVIGANRATVRGNVYADGDVTLENQAQVEGDIYLSGDFQPGHNSSYGNIYTPDDPEYSSPKACPIGTVPEHSSFSNGDEDITLGWNEDKDDIEPGKYDKFNLSGQNEIYMDPGTYYFSEINSGWHLDLYLDFSSEGSYYNIFVQDDVNLGGQLQIYVKGNGDYEPIVQGNQANQNIKELASSVYLETLGSFTMNTQSEWFGSIYAKDDISFGDQNVLIGSYRTSSGIINTANQLKVYHVPYESNDTSSEAPEYIPPIQN
jgi:cytoskeletal protein CcmA (bactofilin family)/Tfp pilus assembly protein PilX